MKNGIITDEEVLTCWAFVEPYFLKNTMNKANREILGFEDFEREVGEKLPLLLAGILVMANSQDFSSFLVGLALAVYGPNTDKVERFIKEVRAEQELVDRVYNLEQNFEQRVAWAKANMKPVEHPDGNTTFELRPEQKFEPINDDDNQEPWQEEIE